MQRFGRLLLGVGVLVTVVVVSTVMLGRPTVTPDAREGADIVSVPRELRPVDQAADEFVPEVDAAARSPQSRVDPAWLASTASAAGIPPRALLAYAAAALELADQEPTCGVGWATLAAIGWAESAHGRHEGSNLGDDGVVAPGILGSPIGPDTDSGSIDDDAETDRAVGPMQFIPDTWSRWGSDGDADGTVDPDDVDDAAFTAARYLCAASGGMTTASGWEAGVAAYNPSAEYRDRVAGALRHYVAAAG